MEKRKLRKNRGLSLEEREGRIGDSTRAHLRTPVSLTRSTTYPVPFPRLSTSSILHWLLCERGGDDKPRKRSPPVFIGFHTHEAATRAHSRHPTLPGHLQDNISAACKLRTRFPHLWKTCKSFIIRHLEGESMPKQNKARFEGGAVNATRNCSITGGQPQLVFVLRMAKGQIDD